MSVSHRIVDLVVDIRRDEVVRCLGYPEGRGATGRTARRIEALWREAQSMLSPRGAMRIVDRATATAVGMPGATDQAVLAVCTVGDALEEEGARKASTGAVLDALVLDAIGSAAAEAAADALNLEICTFAEERGLVAAPRVSPGYGGWDTAWQVALLGLLPTSEVGISLTEGAMMVPRKSVSFAVALGSSDGGAGHEGHRCVRCGLVSCRHRRAPFRGN